MISDLEEHLGYWMRLVSNHVSNSFKKELERYEISVVEWVVLRRLLKQKTLSPATIAEMTSMTRGAISKLLDRLFHKKLIERAESTIDRRFQEIKLSEEGKKILPKIASIADTNDDKYFGYLSKKQKIELMKLLKELAVVHKMNANPIH